MKFHCVCFSLQKLKISQTSRAARECSHWYSLTSTSTQTAQSQNYNSMNESLIVTLESKTEFYHCSSTFFTILQQRQGEASSEKNQLTLIISDDHLGTHY
jgi:hypothetical protein